MFLLTCCTRRNIIHCETTLSRWEDMIRSPFAEIIHGWEIDAASDRRWDIEGRFRVTRESSPAATAVYGPSRASGKFNVPKRI